MKMMICDYAAGCDWKSCKQAGRHERDAFCEPDPKNPDTICPEHPLAKCIPYVDPILKRVQERFVNEAYINQEDIDLLDRIIREESAK